MDLCEHHFEVQRHCVKAYLTSMRGINERMARLSGNIMDVCDKLDVMGVVYDKVNVSGGSASDGKIPDGLAQLEELKRAYVDMMSTEYVQYMKARELCDKRHRGRYAAWLHYVDGHCWATVGRMMGYSKSQAHRMALVGITEIYQGMPEKWRTNPIPDATQV